jgi:ABC-type sugar transport system ATPase subunit
MEVKSFSMVKLLRSTRRAPRRARIETVYQDLALFDNLTPAQNFYCGREIAFAGWLS